MARVMDFWCFLRILIANRPMERWDRLNRHPGDSDCKSLGSLLRHALRNMSKSWSRLSWTSIVFRSANAVADGTFLEKRTSCKIAFHDSRKFDAFWPFAIRWGITGFKLYKFLLTTDYQLLITGFMEKQCFLIVLTLAGFMDFWCFFIDLETV